MYVDSLGFELRVNKIESFCGFLSISIGNSLLDVNWESVDVFVVDFLNIST